VLLAQQEENERLKQAQEKTQREIRRRNVDDYIRDLQGLGFAADSGFLVEVRNALLEDDGGPALLLSEEANGQRSEKSLSVTDVVKRLINAMPKTDKGRILLAEQANDELGLSHKDKPQGVRVELEDRVSQAEDFLYAGMPRKTKKGGEA
jgi:hypothetical protein